MCRICDNRFNVHERAAAHDFVEQMREYYGYPEKHLKDRSRKNERKSIINRIEHQLYRLRSESIYHEELRVLLETPAPVDDIRTRFEDIMTSYYQERLDLR